MGSTQTRRSSRRPQKPGPDYVYVDTSKAHRTSGGPVSDYERGKKKPDGTYTKSKAKRNKGYWRKKRGSNKKKKAKKPKKQWEKDWDESGKQFDKQRKKKKSKK